MPLTSEDTVFRLDSQEKIQLLLNKKRERESEKEIKKELQMFQIINQAVNGSEESMRKFISERQESLKSLEIDKKLKSGFKGTGTLRKRKQ